MSVRVNLLPGDVRERGRANRMRVVAGVAALLLVLVLAGLTFLQRGEISDAEDRLAAVQADNEALSADIAALQPFADLQQRADGSVDVVGVALGGEKSVATVLQDLSAVLPPNAELETLAVTLLPEAGSPAPGGNRLIHGRVELTGRATSGVAPGVERLIVDLDRVAAFDNVYATTSVVNDEGITDFTVTFDLGSEVRTERYVLVDEEVAQ